MADADYQANGPPPDPNLGPAKEESSPVNPPAIASSSSASKEKHMLEHTPASIPSTSGLRMDKSSVVIKKHNVEELMSAHNPNFDHSAITRWSRAEIDRMQAWSKGVHLHME
ncbi:hypothetical protein B0H14DRAFT_2617651 [Mycena olivaceomarginata]|nr:hypothetical protein B0H14DRAFT_2617651 [Mycena olivaceomarginata]